MTDWTAPWVLSNGAWVMALLGTHLCIWLLISVTWRTQSSREGYKLRFPLSSEGLLSSTNSFFSNIFSCSIFQILSLVIRSRNFANVKITWSLDLSFKLFMKSKREVSWCLCRRTMYTRVVLRCHLFLEKDMHLIVGLFFLAHQHNFCLDFLPRIKQKIQRTKVEMSECFMLSFCDASSVDDI